MLKATRIPQQVMYEAFDDETVVVNMDRGHYFSIRGVSARIWNALAVGESNDELKRLFSDIDTKSLDRLLQLLAQEGLIVCDTVPGELLSPEVWLAGTAFENQVERFTDVEGLLLIDPIHEVDQTGWPLAQP